MVLGEGTDTALNHGDLFCWWCDSRCSEGLLFYLRSPHLDSLCFHWIPIIRSRTKCWCWADIIPLQITPQGVKLLTFLCSSFYALCAVNKMYPGQTDSQTCFTIFSSSETSEVPVEDQRLIVSIPSALHSQKPSLSGKQF